MILIRSQGQLGNQLFLLSAVFEAAPARERIVAVGFIELAGLLQVRPNRVFWIPVPHKFDRQVKKVFKSLTRFKFLTTMSPLPSIERHGDWPKAKKLRIKIFEQGLCQRGDITPAPAIKDLASKKSENLSARAQALATLGELGLAPKSFGFVHVRLGDYEEFRVHGHSPVLPRSWYRQSVEFLLERLPGLSLIVLSDDLEHARATLSGIPGNLIFKEMETMESFHIMTLSRAGILSASTFSWWGARLASSESAGPFLAPKFWMGFRAGEWFPSREIESNFLDYKEVGDLCD